VSRRRDALYAGAGGPLPLQEVAGLGPRWAVAPKYDGIYATVIVGRDGALTAAVLRSGKTLSPKLLDEWRGVRWTPDSVLTVELELWTEAANRVAATRGHRVGWIFDAHRVGGYDVTRASYRARRDALMRAESGLVNAGLDRPWLEDDQGDAHDPRTGRYTRPTPRGWRRLRVVEQRPAAAAEQAWCDWVAPGHEAIEGLVAVALDAPLGRRNAKRKVRETTTIDCRVLRVESKLALLEWRGVTFVVSAAGKASAGLAPGAVAEVVFNGWYEKTATPRFARIVRARPDLAQGVIHEA
jgi:hypothetical protein